MRSVEDIVIQYLKGVDKVHDAQKHRELASSDFHSEIGIIIRDSFRDIHYNDIDDDQKDEIVFLPNGFNIMIL